VIHRGVWRLLKAEDCAGESEIQDLAGAVIEKYREGDPAIENNEIGGADVTLTIEIRSDGDDLGTGFQIGDRAELISYRHLCLLYIPGRA
jgi:hypothetical protein